jgi:hypothetical protein
MIAVLLARYSTSPNFQRYPQMDGEDFLITPAPRVFNQSVLIYHFCNLLDAETFAA